MEDDVIGAIGNGIGERWTRMEAISAKLCQELWKEAEPNMCWKLVVCEGVCVDAAGEIRFRECICLNVEMCTELLVCMLDGFYNIWCYGIVAGFEIVK